MVFSTETSIGLDPETVFLTSCSFLGFALWLMLTRIFTQVLLRFFFLLWYGLHSVGSPSALNQLSEMHTSAEVKWFAAKLLLWLSVYLIRWPSLLEREMHSLISRTALSLWPAVPNHGLDMWQKILLWCLCYAAPLARSASLFLSVWLVLFLFPFNLSSLNASCAEPTEA